MIDGKVAFERYARGYEPTIPHNQALSTLTLYLQSAVLDLAANRAGAGTTGNGKALPAGYTSSV